MMINQGTRFSHYEILSPIGAGGMGEVWLAEDTRLDRKVAIKALSGEFNNNEDRLRRFIGEAKAASALNHPNILTVYDIGQTDSGTHFIATEYINGETLRHYIQCSRMKRRDALDLITQVASALAAAHQAGIIHRDIKPENIMRRPDGIAKVLDFGLAKLTERATPTTDSEAATISKQATDPGTIMGTVAYMSPEQARGKEVDARTDIFSLGIVLYEMVAGRPPFAGESSTDVLAAIIDKEPPPLLRYDDETPAELQRIVTKCLRKERDERYQTMRDVLLDLRELRDELALEAKLERSIRPTSNIDHQQTQIAEAEITRDQPPPPTIAATPQRTSSAEYLVSEIKNHKRGITVALLIVLLSAVGLGYRYFFNRGAGNKQIESIAVMPFVNESANADVEYLSDGMTETLISTLSQLPNLNVKARSSVFRYKGNEFDLQKIAQELKVQAILTGRVVQRGDQLTLSLELVDAQTGNAMWSEQYNRKQTDLVTLQSEIARDVSNKLKIKLASADQLKLAKRYTDDPETYRLYLQGRFYWNKRTPSEVEKAVVFFKQAVEKDPNFALGYVGLADSFEDVDRPHKKEYIRRALEIDDQLAEAHASLGYQYMLDYSWAASEREMKKAMELNPNYPQSHAWNGARLMMIGKYDESLTAIQRGLELDPTSNGINFYKGVCLYVAGRRDEAIQQFKRLIQMDPTFSWAHGHLARVYRLNGDYAAAVEERAISYELDGKLEAAKAARESFARGGWEAVQRSMQQQEPNSNFWGILNETDEEKWIAKLMKQAEQGNFWLFLIKTDPIFDPLRGDPRFQELLKKFNPPQ